MLVNVQKCTCLYKEKNPCAHKEQPQLLLAKEKNRSYVYQKSDSPKSVINIKVEKGL